MTLQRPLTVIGRSSDVDVQLADTGVSRRHGELLLQPDGRHVYRDLGSTNGSRVNGRKVHEVPLVDGDRIEVGRSVLVYRHPAPTRESEGRQGGELSGHPAEA
jgi:pSer/pThr/pTyr-binding forkhead associated (FHA) protein